MRLPILEKLLPGKKHVGVIRDSVSDIHDDPTIRLASKTIERIRESPRIMRMRSLLKQEFGYPEEEFDRIWVSYTLSLRTFGGKNRDWNSDIEDMLRSLGVPEADIVLARTDLPTAVFHRIYCASGSNGKTSVCTREDATDGEDRLDHRPFGRHHNLAKGCLCTG